MSASPHNIAIENAAKGAPMRLTNKGTGAGRLRGKRERGFLSRSSERTSLTFPEITWSLLKKLQYTPHLKKIRSNGIQTGGEQQKV